MQVRVRLGAGLARLSAAPLLTVELADGATVADLYARLRDTEPELAPALRSVLPVVAGEHVPRPGPGPPRRGRPAAPGLRRLTEEHAMAIEDQTPPAAPSSSTRSPTACSAPTSRWLGPVADGGHIVWNSTPGCWGPMITPSIRGGHEVCTPVAVDGAEVGDAIAIRIKDIEVTSQRDRRRATTRRWRAASTAIRTARPVCPGCGTEWPETRLEGIGETAVRCATCGADATPFTFTNGYTIAFDGRRRRDASPGARPRSSRATPRAPPRCPTTRSRTRS